MWTTRKQRLAEALNATALAMIAEARTCGPAEARELNELATQLDELRVKMAIPGPVETEIQQWPRAA